MKPAALFTIIYEDDYIIAVNKAAGIAVGGDRWDEARERLDRLLAAYCPAGVFTVHRIDRDTSGAVVFAKDAQTHKRLCVVFEERRAVKRYIAVVHGRFSPEETACELPLVPGGDKQHRTIIDKYRGKKAVTRFRLLGSAGNYSVVEALPETGRTHQIRVHLASLGHPVVCDPLYGEAARRGHAEKGVFLSSFKKGWRGDPLTEQPLLARLGLHALHLTLPDYHEDASGCQGLSLYAPLSRDMATLVTQLAKRGGFALPDAGSVLP
ncbi:MAG: RluA family pseudouridine synthase [Treponema sp.]|jgi:RluA family pseudouridine synthase|nr:RluA family pseudouridine synthase [Treponema sp.]